MAAVRFLHQPDLQLHLSLGGAVTVLVTGFRGVSSSSPVWQLPAQCSLPSLGRTVLYFTRSPCGSMAALGPAGAGRCTIVRTGDPASSLDVCGDCGGPTAASFPFGSQGNGSSRLPTSLFLWHSLPSGLAF